MTQVHAINKNGKIIVVNKDFDEESREHFMQRSWWIAKQVCKHPKKDLQEIENDSCIWSCVVNHGVTYDENVMKRIH